MTAVGGFVSGGLSHQLGRYRVLERIGRGAMSVVYAALDEQMGRRVAIKMLPMAVPSVDS